MRGALYGKDEVDGSTPHRALEVPVNEDFLFSDGRTGVRWCATHARSLSNLRSRVVRTRRQCPAPRFRYVRRPRDASGMASLRLLLASAPVPALPPLIV